MEVKEADILLCEFYFSDLKKSKKRPVLVLKDNLPYNDFVAIPISSKINSLHDDEELLDNTKLISGQIPKESKLMIRKTFVVSKNVVIKKYGSLSNESFKYYHKQFCKYFACAGI
jgi:mRNA interferase MazF